VDHLEGVQEMRQVEMIISYTTDGTDYEYHDNHGVLIRCKDCKYFAGEGMYCENDIIVHFDHFYCYNAERRTDEVD
jgi:hypothetical protein